MVKTDEHSADSVGAVKVELGADAAYPEAYDSTLLQAIPRSLSRAELCASQFFGLDLWNAYELSWLKPSGLPQVAIAEFAFDAKNPNIVESKSFKYYLNSLNQAVFASVDELKACLQRDLSRCVGGPVQVSLWALNNAAGAQLDTPPGECLDELDIDIEYYEPQAHMLQLDRQAGQWRERCFYSHLLKSNCPVTGQPDWATVWFQYSGPAFDRASLLRYLVAFRQYQGFHESCVERIFTDISAQFAPEALCVYARYTRRGGLDINPFRVSENWRSMTPPFRRLLRQ
ncbi:NADPH-dependent 7-cyano-7-deazaguanine reductase QueF [Agaribacterium haliotis]|uniref:NADPH-dependent 7-cyano-7-deazaguanine reductase QueF n=1 Tax=Agaribacterium haliotis TaxID=2013869 RepID=UPI000BB57448|nr:NADPH-dependent 7-cyano-7-deazaguanine reductase QueF [Agaribacterium haliotis]